MEFLKNLNWPLILGVGVGGIALISIVRNAQGSGQESADTVPTFFTTGDVGGFGGAGPISGVPNAGSDAFPGIADAIKNLSDTTSVAIANNTKLQEAAISQGTTLGQLQIVGDIARQNAFKVAPGQSLSISPTTSGGVEITSKTKAQNDAVTQSRATFNETQRQKVATNQTVIRTNQQQKTIAKQTATKPTKGGQSFRQVAAPKPTVARRRGA